MEKMKREERREKSVLIGYIWWLIPMGYLVVIGEKFLDPENNPDYINLKNFSVNTTDIHRIICSMNNLGIDIWVVKENRKTIYKSPLFQKIEQDRFQRRTQIKSE